MTSSSSTFAYSAIYKIIRQKSHWFCFQRIGFGFDLYWIGLADVFGHVHPVQVQCLNYDFQQKIPLDWFHETLSRAMTFDRKANESMHQIWQHAVKYRSEHSQLGSRWLAGAIRSQLQLENGRQQPQLVHVDDAPGNLESALQRGMRCRIVLGFIWYFLWFFGLCNPIMVVATVCSNPASSSTIHGIPTHPYEVWRIVFHKI